MNGQKGNEPERPQHPTTWSAEQWRAHHEHSRCVRADAALTATARLLYAALLDRAGQRGVCTAGQRRLAVDCGAHVATIARALAELERAGLIQALPRSGTRATEHRFPSHPVFGLAAAEIEPAHQRPRSASARHQPSPAQRERDARAQRPRSASATHEPSARAGAAQRPRRAPLAPAPRERNEMNELTSPPPAPPETRAPRPATAAQGRAKGEGEEGVREALRAAGVSARAAAELAGDLSLTGELVERVAAEVRRRGAGPGALVAELRDPATLAVHAAELHREREQRAAREAAAAARQRAAPPARPADETERAAAALLARLTPESVARVKRAIAQRAPALAEQIARTDWQPGPLTAADVVELVEDELIAEAHAVAAANGITWPHAAAAS